MDRKMKEVSFYDYNTKALWFIIIIGMFSLVFSIIKQEIYGLVTSVLFVYGLFTYVAWWHTDNEFRRGYNRGRQLYKKPKKVR